MDDYNPAFTHLFKKLKASPIIRNQISLKTKKYVPKLLWLH